MVHFATWPTPGGTRGTCVICEVPTGWVRLGVTFSLSRTTRRNAHVNALGVTKTCWGRLTPQRVICLPALPPLPFHFFIGNLWLDFGLVCWALAAHLLQLRHPRSVTSNQSTLAPAAHSSAVCLASQTRPKHRPASWFRALLSSS